MIVEDKIVVKGVLDLLNFGLKNELVSLVK